MNHDEFDQQIRDALRVEPSREQAARLEGFWKLQLQADGRRRVRWKVAVAACVLLAATISARLLWPEPARQEAQVNQESPVAVELAPSEPHDVVLPDSPPGDSQSSFSGRPSTDYERLMFAVRTAKHSASESSIRIAAIDKVIERLRLESTADAKELILSAGLTEFDAEQEFLRRLQRSTDDDKSVILKLLAACGSARSAPALLQLARRESSRDVALGTLESIVGVAKLADVIDQTSDPQVRAAIFRRLFAADTEPALRGYLSWVYDEAYRAESLAVAETVTHPTLGWLLALLDDENETVRLSAALVLGHVNGPEVTESLISLVMQEPSEATEAWVALFACRGQAAEEFFTYAAFQPRLLAHVNSARAQWARLIP